jgi:hypothetical protein
MHFKPNMIKDTTSLLFNKLHYKNNYFDVSYDYENVMIRYKSGENNLILKYDNNHINLRIGVPFSFKRSKFSIFIK